MFAENSEMRFHSLPRSNEYPFGPFFCGILLIDLLQNEGS